MDLLKPTNANRREDEMEDKFEHVFFQCGQRSHVYFQCSSLFFCEHERVYGSKTTKSHSSHDLIVTHTNQKNLSIQRHASMDYRNKQLQQLDICVIDMAIF